MFKEVNKSANFPKLEEEIINFWRQNGIFKQSLKIRENSPIYVFYDGPPFATGLPHYGHFVPGILKDVIPRYKTMKGYHVERKWGWDCHGLPVENEMEKDLNIKTKKDIINYGVANFNESCRSIVLKYTSEWQKIIERSGRWVDFENAYRTMDPQYMESIWWVFKSLWEKGLVYEGFKTLPYCTRCATPLSNFEVNLGGYIDIKEQAITVKFQSDKDSNMFFLAWTTTPWTLPSNLALAVGSDIEYVKIFDHDSKIYYVLANKRLSAYYPDSAKYTIIKRFKGEELENEKYIPIFKYFNDIGSNTFSIVLADYVSIEDGTGIVHTAPGFGEDDFNTGLKYGLPIVAPVDENGEFTDDIVDYKGMHVKKADSFIIDDLIKKELLFNKNSITHAYPICWRCDEPLIYKAVSTWFVKIDPIKQIMIDANNETNWVPDHIKKGRFGKWLEGARDWAISRNRFWGTPLPVWKCTDCEHTICIGSISELEQFSGQKFNDIHKHFVDPIEFKCLKCGNLMKRVPEVLDCWFESGSMPYAQEHYPFENNNRFLSRFPADFIAEAIDQTRGWFYTLTVIASAIFEKQAFKNCIVNGLVLDEQGKKMSKKLKNYSDPTYIMNTYGADALRLYLLNSALLKAEDLKFSENGVKEVVKNVLLPLWNSYSFLITYANIDNWQPDHKYLNDIQLMKSFQNELDRWILSLLQTLTINVVDVADSYKLHLAVSPIIDFIDDLTNWYIRRSRRRFWKSENDQDKNEAYYTLYHVLITLIKIAAPYIPYTTEIIYQNLKTFSMPSSVHLCDYPQAITEIIDKQLEERMFIVQKVVFLGRYLRTAHNLKIRQPLSKVFIINPNKHELDLIIDLFDLIKEELNVKEVVVLSDESRIIQYNAKPNFRKLGKIFGKNISKVQKAIVNLTSSQIALIQQGQIFKIFYDDFTYDLTVDDIVVERASVKDFVIANENCLTVALDTIITHELRQECDVREIINKIQNMRKESNFNVIDKIEIIIWASENIIESIDKFSQYICNETLCQNLMVYDKNKTKSLVNAKIWEINEYEIFIYIKKV